ncbi:glutamate racemase [Wohlfahrtiimonas sp. G9077]|uniref:glutamate racemase n=1 Tax=Wohlfahrtiimonas sp. G9077 TaxID=1980118 RepID=UPI001F3CF4BF|nr:glutamate racemase [Wohlfahrtiimonas sp. G9077]
MKKTRSLILMSALLSPLCVANMKIGFIDSGIGGLSVMSAFIDYPLPADYYYIADTAHLPYGLKSHEYIHERITTLTEYLLATHHIDMLVIACNTATAISAEKLRHQLPQDFPIIGIEPAIKPAARASITKEIAIVATSSMIENPRLTRLIDQFAHEVSVIKIAADPWVTLVEKGDTESMAAQITLQETLNVLNNTQVDQLILGCTHFPFLQEALMALVPPSVTLVNPAFAVAKHAEHCLQACHIAPERTPSFHYFTTGNLNDFQHQITHLQLPSGTVHTLDI